MGGVGNTRSDYLEAKNPGPEVKNLEFGGRLNSNVLKESSSNMPSRAIASPHIVGAGGVSPGRSFGPEALGVVNLTRNVDVELRSQDDLASRSSTIWPSNIWQKAAGLIIKKIDPQIYAAWIKPLSLIDVRLIETTNGVTHSSAEVVLAVRNGFTRDHLRNRYGSLIAESLAEVLGVESVALKFDLSSEEMDKPQENLNGSSNGGIHDQVATTTRLKKPTRAPRQLDTSHLNPKYNFSNFVVGACNQFAHAVSLRVSETPGSNYNPLFIYGGVGLGKTHLVNAIGNASKRRGKKVLLVSSEIFVNELIASLRSNSMQQFKDKFRSLDLLIVDDIQFLIGKERTQEEFFHTFNALYQRRSQIVITSDKVPQELIGLESRLRTRFASGLSADLQTPDFETRVAILMKKSEAEHIDLPQSVAQLLAEKIDSNVRELEGALNRLHALSTLNKAPINVELAEDALRTIVPDKTRELTTELIQKTVAEQYNLTLKDLLGKRRTQNIAFPRQVAMSLCRRLTTCSYPEIGALFGGRDHSTVIHANRVIEERMRDDSALRAEIEQIERKLKGR